MMLAFPGMGLILRAIRKKTADRARMNIVDAANAFVRKSVHIVRVGQTGHRTDMRLSLSLCLAAFALISSPAISASPQVLIEQAIAVSSSQSMETEAYLVVNNATSKDAQIVGVSGGSGTSVEFHDRLHKPRQQGFLVPVRSELYMQPGGLHIALVGARNAPGTRLPLRVTFDDRSVTELSVPVAMAPDGIPDHHRYQH